MSGSSPGMTSMFVSTSRSQIQLRILAARRARGLPIFCPSKNGGRREDRVRAAPAVSCAKCTRKCAHEHTGSAETLRPSPRNGFTAYFALSLVTGFLATIVREKRLLLKNLTPASGRQNHTTSPSAQATLVSRSPCVHRIPPHV